MTGYNLTRTKGYLSDELSIEIDFDLTTIGLVNHGVFRCIEELFNEGVGGSGHNELRRLKIFKFHFASAKALCSPLSCFGSPGLSRLLFSC